MEFLDVINSEGIPTGEKKTRKDVHAEGLWHNTVHVYVFRKTATGLEFLVHLRSKSKDHSPNTWDTRFGGHLKSGETIEQAVVGELRDEVGLTVNIHDLIPGFTENNDWSPNNRERVTSFYYELKDESFVAQFNDNEVQEVKWVSAPQAEEELGTNSQWSGGGLESFRMVLKDIKSKLTS